MATDPAIAAEEPSQFFEIPLYMQRYKAVSDIIDRHNQRHPIRKVVDLGCAECKYLQYVSRLPFIESIVGVDKDHQLLRSSCAHLKPLMADFLSPRGKPLEMLVLCGDFTLTDSRLLGADVVTLIEVIEHLFEDSLQALVNNVFGWLQPSLVVVTTPNSEFNILFPNFSGKRHYDHKFEWTRKEFSNWCESVCKEHNYTVTFDGVGHPPPASSALGYCSQIAIFERCSSAEPLRRTAGHEAAQNLPYTQMALVEYPSCSTNADEAIDNVLLYCLMTLANRSQGDFEDLSCVTVRLDHLLAQSVQLSESCDVVEITARLTRLGYVVRDSDVVVDMNHYECSESSAELSPTSCQREEEQYAVEECW